MTPSGTPAATKPMKAGTALQEQNGVATPSPAAATLPTPFALAAEQGAGALDREEAAQDADDEDDPDQQQQDLRRVVEEEVERIRPARPARQR